MLSLSIVSSGNEVLEVEMSFETDELKDDHSPLASTPSVDSAICNATPMAGAFLHSGNQMIIGLGLPPSANLSSQRNVLHTLAYQDQSSEIRRLYDSSANSEELRNEVMVDFSLSLTIALIVFIK